MNKFMKSHKVALERLEKKLSYYHRKKIERDQNPTRFAAMIKEKTEKFIRFEEEKKLK